MIRVPYKTKTGKVYFLKTKAQGCVGFATVCQVIARNGVVMGTSGPVPYGFTQAAIRKGEALAEKLAAGKFLP